MTSQKRNASTVDQDAPQLRLKITNNYKDAAIEQAKASMETPIFTPEGRLHLTFFSDGSEQRSFETDEDVARGGYVIVYTHATCHWD